MELGRGMGIRQVRVPQSVLFLQIQPFFPFEKCSSDVASLWSSESVDFDFFFFFLLTVRVAFIEERILGGPYSTILDDVTLIVF